MVDMSDELKKLYGYIPIASEILKEVYQPTIAEYLRSGEDGYYRVDCKEGETKEQWKERKTLEAEKAKFERTELRKKETWNFTNDELISRIMQKFNWTTGMAQHFAQPYCDCNPFGGEFGPNNCAHADDLEIRWPG